MKNLGRIVHVPGWWVYDKLADTVYCEGKETSKLFFNFRLPQLLHKNNYFLGRTCKITRYGKGKSIAIPINGGVSLLLLGNREINKSNAEKLNHYEFRCVSSGLPDEVFKEDLYLALHNHGHYRNWDRDKEIRELGMIDVNHSRVQLISRNGDGDRIADYIRVIVPVGSNFIAISEKGKCYFLFGEPSDMPAVMDSFYRSHPSLGGPRLKDPVAF